MGIKRRAVGLIETVAGFALMAVAFGPRATAMIAFEAYRPTKALAVAPDDGTACTHFERGNRNEHYKEV